eukprot:CAMPEP_0169100466 /NCGR_PEP_ID=MMETSP1015-20121227/21106_1 /TAXON_ID=342587 /ORGANISM="Karlodinium micrum, Strain CCMP2283" /LENGTH=56 /DNA_ID=CAMNT_0009161417 /DNA_START=80 /DNA_END=250 /DNA_ORIENTATION=-
MESDAILVILFLVLFIGGIVGYMYYFNQKYGDAFESNRKPKKGKKKKGGSWSIGDM